MLSQADDYKNMIDEIIQRKQDDALRVSSIQIKAGLQAERKTQKK